MFERFTPEARQTVVLAQEQARQLGHDWIGTEHLLLALLADPEGITCQALTSLGVRAEAVRTEIEMAVPGVEMRPTGNIPFTPRAKKVLELSLRMSIKLRQRSIEPGHILLGIIQEGEGLAAQALIKHGADLEELRLQVFRRLAPMGERAGRTVAPNLPELTPAGVAVFDLARQLAAGKPIGSQHLLLGLFGPVDSLAGRALSSLGVTREAADAALAALDPAGTADEPPEQAGARRTRLQVVGDVVTLKFEDKELAGRLGASLRRFGRRGSAGEFELPGTEPAAAEPFARLWRAAQAVSQDIMHRLGDEPERMGPARGGWRPQGWSTRASVAGYSVTSEPDGPHSRLWISEGLDEGAVRAWLADWMAAVAPPARPDEETAHLALLVGHRREVVPDSPHPDAWAVTNFSFGAGPAPADWPRLPLEHLMAFAIDDLRRPPEPDQGEIPQ